jgi:hypothetical protein
MNKADTIELKDCIESIVNDCDSRIEFQDIGPDKDWCPGHTNVWEWVVAN